MSPTVTIRPGASDEEIIDKTITWKRTREVGKMRRAQITVAREDAETVTLTEKEDDIKLGDIDTLRLVDIETGGPTWTLKCYSHEWLANTVEPTAGGTLRTGSDADLVNGWITDVSQWTAGTVTQQATGLSFVFNHAAPHEGLRRVEKNVPGELKFRDTGTVDYIDRLGTDKTGSVTLSSANQNIEDEIRITKRGRELDGTHIRVLGAHEGEAQFFANLVPSDDSASYDNRVNYSTSRWSDGDTRDWDRYVNKDVTDQATIEEEAAELGTEITERLVEAKATTTLDLDIGDTVQVTKTDADLDRAMRAHRIKEVAEGGTVKRELLLSTRTIVRSDDAKDLRDIQRFNSGFQGSSVVVQGGGSRQPVDATNNAEIPFFYPNLEFENEAELFVRGLNYRHYSVPNNHSHDVTHPSHAHDVTHPSHAHIVSISTTSGTNAEHNTVEEAGLKTPSTLNGNTSWTDLASFGGSLNDHEVFQVWCHVSATHDEEIQIRLKNEDTGELFPVSDGLVWLPSSSGDRPQDVTVVLTAPTNASEYTVQDKASSSFSSVASPVFSWMTWDRHDHDVSDTETSTTELGTTETSTTALGTTETSTTALGTTETTTTAAGATAGIEETNDTPTSVDVRVDGATVATDIGTDLFQTTVDISNELTKNAWNLIELTSDSLGHIQGTVSIQGYDQIGKS